MKSLIECVMVANREQLHRSQNPYPISELMAHLTAIPNNKWNLTMINPYIPPYTGLHVRVHLIYFILILFHPLYIAPPPSWLYLMCQDFPFYRESPSLSPDPTTNYQVQRTNLRSSIKLKSPPKITLPHFPSLFLVPYEFAPIYISLEASEARKILVSDYFGNRLH